MYVEYYGMVYLEYWEYVVSFVYIAVLYLYFARQKNVRIKTNPEYRYFLWGLFAKILGGIAFSLIYWYYYGGGDTTAYFYSSVAMSNLFFKAPMDMLKVLFGPTDLEHLSYFSLDTGKPYNYVYYDTRAFMVIRLITPLTILCFNSYLVTTVVLASLSFVGVWKCFQMFYGYYPRLHRELAIAVLFMPSSLLWGSCILKDTFTFSAFCWFIYAVDRLFLKKRDQVASGIAIWLCSMIIIAIKPYIFMVMFPLAILWSSYARISRIRNALVKYLFLPLAMVVLAVGVVVVLDLMGDRFGKFSLDNALESIIIAQKDLTQADAYGSNYFDVGPMEATWPSVLSKFHIAVFATLFRPFILECKNFVMALAGIENAFLLFIFFRMLWRSRIVGFLTALIKNPLVLVCFAFAVFYGFITGISTPNFGALVRFRIPLLPLFVSGIYIVDYLMLQRRKTRALGLNFRYDDYRSGDPDPYRPIVLKRRQEAVEALQRKKLSARDAA